MELNKKSLNILNLFFHQNKFNYQDLEEKLQIKKRSIDQNINIINEFLKKFEIKGIQKDKDYFFIEPNDIEVIRDLLKFAPLSVQERKDYLLLQLFFKNQINLNENIEILNITRRTLNYDLIDVKNSLEKKSLSIESYPGKGVFLIGKEENIRKNFYLYLAKYLINKDKTHILFINLIDNFIPEKNILEAKGLFSKIINKIPLSLTPEDFYKMISIILVGKIRNNHFPINKDYKTSSTLENHLYYEMTLTFLRNNGLKDLSICDLDLIINNLFFLDASIYNKLDTDTKTFVKNIEEVLNIDISKDFYLLMQISNIIRIGKYKVKFDIFEKNKVFNLNSGGEELFLQIKDIIREIVPKFHLEDILYLAILFRNYLDNTTVSNLKKITIIDNSFGQILGNSLVNYLKESNSIKIVKLIGSYEIDENIDILNKSDYILTMDKVEIPNLDTPIIQINIEDIFNKNLNVLVEKFFA